ncbi:Anaerobic sulfatase-maturating enzyme [Porphyromonas gingivalis]|uniref:radical SAM/SPASM domain-containing protein n=1 Tax=Porphyromonas gingivalis TaxID=837 RepID=UPI000974FC1A|nr:radical SAM protein [Porphyromonas gingivalis]SJL31088.1 Anaerobic sulfatase-maturating enzyme [Porphyromonas gingivalis]
MRKNYFLFDEEISPEVFLLYNAFTNDFLLLNESKHDLFNNPNVELIEQADPSFYKKMVEGIFFVPDDYKELEIVHEIKRKMMYNSSMYHILVNTTLDCNLNCWYCYENKVAESRIEKKVIEAIKKNIVYEYDRARFNVLKVSFFGGEPFLHFEGIKLVLDFAKKFCEEREVELIADFTTNATLIDENIILYLKQFTCHFQITLDGDRKVHNKIKKDIHNPNRDTYKDTIKAIYLANKFIENKRIAVRINFSNRTLEKIDEIIADIDFLCRKSSFVILKKVWQIEKEKVNKNLLFEAIQKLFDKGFLVDYYIMPKGCVCFAERERYALFNYDGKIFKCSTISAFNEQNALGTLNFSTGVVSWDLNKQSCWHKSETQKECETCKWFPVCLGPCGRQLQANKGRFICTFDAMNMTTKEYLIYSYKFHHLRSKML